MKQKRCNIAVRDTSVKIKRSRTAWEKILVRDNLVMG